MAISSCSKQPKNTTVGLAESSMEIRRRNSSRFEPTSGDLRRLSRIEGQIRGIQRMVEEDRYCADILKQVTSAQEALRAVARSLMRNHLTDCASHAIMTGS